MSEMNNRIVFLRRPSSRSVVAHNTQYARSLSPSGGGGGAEKTTRARSLFSFPCFKSLTQAIYHMTVYTYYTKVKKCTLYTQTNERRDFEVLVVVDCLE